MRQDSLFLLLAGTTVVVAVIGLLVSLCHFSEPLNGVVVSTLERYLVKEETEGRTNVKPDKRQPDNTQTVSHHLFPTSPKLTRILLLPEKLEWEDRQANARHLLQDGVAQSPLLQWTEEYHRTDVLMLDLLGAREEYDDWCEEITKQVKRILQQQQQQQQQRLLPLAVVDNRDYAVFSRCETLEALLLLQPSSSPSNTINNTLRYSYRSLVHKRRWLKQRQWVGVGTKVDPLTVDKRDVDHRSSFDTTIYEYKHRPIGVRTDIVLQIQDFLQQSKSKLQLCHPIEDVYRRTIHASYFWDHQQHTRDDAHLRDTVYEQLEVFANKHDSYDILLGVQGHNRALGRKQASPDYVAALLQSQIVVVAQRDEWEDHYRLQEAIVSGAMVMTDTMLGLPQGLVHGESVVVYSNIQELHDNLEYYLQHSEERIQIAKRGRRIAMSRHRSWHHMEEIVFGVPVTVCNKTHNDGGDARCPFVVHAKDINEPCPPLPKSFLALHKENGAALE